MSKGKSKLVTVLLGVVVLAVLVVVGFVLVNRPRVPVVTLPTPNGYEMLSRAGAMVSGLPDDYATTTDAADLQSCLDANGEALQLILRAVDEQHLNPIDYDSGMQAVLDGTAPVRQALRLLHTSARLAELQEDKGSEALDYARLFAVSSKSSNGGLLVHTMAAAVYELEALSRLKDIVQDLDASQKSEVLAVLAYVNRQPTDVDRVLDRERVLVKKEHGTLSGSWMLWLTKGNMQPAVQRFVQTDAEVVELYKQVLELIGQ